MALDELKKVAVKAIVDELLKRLAESYKWTVWITVNPVLSFLLTKVFTEVLKEVELVAFSHHIGIVTKEQADNFDSASNNLHDAINGGDEDEIKKAEQSIIDAALELISVRR